MLLCCCLSFVASPLRSTSVLRSFDRGLSISIYVPVCIPVYVPVCLCPSIDINESSSTQLPEAASDEEEEEDVSLSSQPEAQYRLSVSASVRMCVCLSVCMPLCPSVHHAAATSYSSRFSPFSDCSGAALDVFVRPRLAQLTARRLSRKRAVRLMRAESEGGRAAGARASHEGRVWSIEEVEEADAAAGDHTCRSRLWFTDRSASVARACVCACAAFDG